MNEAERFCHNPSLANICTNSQFDSGPAGMNPIYVVHLFRDADLYMWCIYSGTLTQGGGFSLQPQQF